MEWWDESNSDLELSPLGLPEDSDWVLYAPNNFEPILTNNPFMHELSRQVGRYSPRTRFVEVYMNTSGGAVTSSHYNGIYVLGGEDFPREGPGGCGQAGSVRVNAGGILAPAVVYT